MDIIYIITKVYQTVASHFLRFQDNSLFSFFTSQRGISQNLEQYIGYNNDNNKNIYNLKMYDNRNKYLKLLKTNS